MRKLPSRLIVLIVALLGASLHAAPQTQPVAVAGDWPCWRGPLGDGSSSESRLPTKWSASEGIAWKAAIPGKGHSSPVVVGDRIFLTTCLEDSGKRLLLCLSRRDGSMLWQREVITAPLEKKHDLNSYASATPCSDGQRLWVSFFGKPQIDLVCYDLEGKELWRRIPGTFSSVHGFCSSPILYKDMVILNCDQDAPASIVALDKESGAERYRIDRPNRTRSYCTPLIREAAGRMQMMLSGSKCVASYDPDTGKPLWLVDGPTEQFVASLVYTDNVLFVTGGFPEHHLLGINPDGSGNVTQSKTIWHDHRGVSYVPSPVAYDKWFFLVSDDGIGTCWEAASGKMLWKQRLSTHQSASGIVSADGVVYFTDDHGDTAVLKASPTFELISHNPLGDECYASPAVSNGQVFIRTLHTLWCVSGK